jgi:hypothetical protein
MLTPADFHCWLGATPEAPREAARLQRGVLLCVARVWGAHSGLPLAEDEGLGLLPSSSDPAGTPP